MLLQAEARAPEERGTGATLISVSICVHLWLNPPELRIANWRLKIAN
jgi:hypothetical protein